MPLFKIKSLIFLSGFLAGLWLGACKTPPTPNPPAPSQPETRETTDASRSTPPPPSQSAEPGAQETSNSQKTPPTASAPQKPESQEKSKDRQTASTGATEPRSPEAGQHLPENREKAAQTPDAKLAKARDDLRVSQATEKRIASDLEALKKSGNASDEEIRNYEAYLERVQAMVAENRQTVKKMESAYNQQPPGEKAPGETVTGELQKQSDQKIPEEQTQDSVSELDRQLSASLSEFDAMLLKKMEAIETESAAKMSDLAHEAAEAAKRLKQKGVEIDSAEPKSSGEAAEKDAENPQKKEGEKEASRGETGTETQQGDGDNTTASAGRSQGEGPGPKQDRGSRYSKEDDDIVARQLREAAEKETDPELKEKLWKEYEEYKKNTQP